ncbi:MAG: hypothetical protein Kow002_07580 [Anaerolineales bacterium]
MGPSTIGGINRLPEEKKRRIYSQIIPKEILERFHLPELESQRLQQFIKFDFESGSTDVEISLFHEKHFPDPVLYGHMTDTMNGQIHILLYILNDPDSERFNVDHMPDGRLTRFGTRIRNLEAEEAAMNAGLSPGQIRKGLGMLSEAMQAFEGFVESLGHDMYFAEPLYYHNAVIFERYGFAYQMGRKRMEAYHAGFSNGGAYHALLNGSSPFRRPEAENSIRLRSWAIHDGILGEPFTDVTMYKHIGKSANVNTAPGCGW